MSSALPFAAVGLSGISKLFEGFSQSQAYNYQAHVAQINAAIAQRGATTALQEGQTAESAMRIKTGMAVAGATAGQAAGGVDTSGGSTSKVRSQIQNLGDLDALTIRYNAAQKAYGHSTEAQGYRSEAEMDKSASTNSLIGGFIGGASSSLNSYYQFQQMGAFGG